MLAKLMEANEIETKKQLSLAMNKISNLKEKNVILLK